jgi:hypothetical protein
MGPWKQLQNTCRVITAVVHATNNAKDIYSPVESNARLLSSHTGFCNEYFHTKPRNPTTISLNKDKTFSFHNPPTHFSYECQTSGPHKLDPEL